MHDVAALAGVSIKTVSRVINGEPRVAPATIAKVEQAVAALGFERNDLARSLRPGHRTHTLGVIIEDLHNPFFPALMEGVDLVAQDHGYLVMSASTHARCERERELVKALLRRRIDGLGARAFAVGSPLHREMRRPRADRLHRSASKHMQADSVVVDNAGGARQAVAHLVGQGHRRVAFVGDGGSVESAKVRLENFRQAMAEGAGGLDDALIGACYGLIGEEKLHTATRRCALAGAVQEQASDGGPDSQQPNDVGALRALRGREDAVALVGFDDLDDRRALGITVVHTNLARARQAWQRSCCWNASEGGPTGRNTCS